MRTNRARIIVLLVFVVTLGAGVAAGLLAAKLPSANVPNVVSAPGDSPLAEELELSADQREKMQKIWEGVRDLSEESFAGSRQAEQTRDREIAKLIPAEKMDQYRAVWRTYAETNAALKGRRTATFEKAVARTKEILSLPQQKKYDAILAKRLGTQDAAVHDPVNQATLPGSTTQPTN